MFLMGSFIVFNNDLKTSAQRLYWDIVQWSFYFWNVFFLLDAFLCYYWFREHSIVTFTKNGCSFDIHITNKTLRGIGMVMYMTMLMYLVLVE